MANNFGKYKKSLSEEEIEIIETRCNDVMTILGYSKDTSANWKKPSPSVIDKLYYSNLNRKKSVYKNKNVSAEVNAVLMDRSKLVKEMIVKRKKEWKELK